MQQFIDKMNKKSRYSVRLWYVEDLIKNMEAEQDRISIEFKEGTSIDITDKINLLKYLHISKITNSALEELYQNTSDKNIELLIKYRKVSDKLSKTKGFFQNIKMEKHENVSHDDYGKEKIEVWESGYICPKFCLNTNKMVTVSQPSLPFSKEEIQYILTFEYAIVFDSLEEINEFLRKYKILIFNRSSDISDFFILGTTIYINILDKTEYMIPFDYSFEEEDEIKELIPQFYKIYKRYKLIAVNYDGYPEESVKQQQEQWEKEIAEENKAIAEKVEDTVADMFKTANIEEKNEKIPEDTVDIKAQIQHVVDTVSKFNSVLNKLNAEREEVKKEEEIKHYIGKIANIELNYTKKEALINSFNLVELFFQSSNTEELKTNVFNFLIRLTPTWSNIDNFNFVLDGLNIIASIEIEMVDTEEKYMLSLEAGQLKITAI